jgi:hypothetical protein
MLARSPAAAREPRRGRSAPRVSGHGRPTRPPALLLSPRHRFDDGNRRPAVSPDRAGGSRSALPRHRCRRRSSERARPRPCARGRSLLHHPGRSGEPVRGRCLAARRLSAAPASLRSAAAGPRPAARGWRRGWVRLPRDAMARRRHDRPAPGPPLLLPVLAPGWRSDPNTERPEPVGGRSSLASRSRTRSAVLRPRKEREDHGAKEAEQAETPPPARLVRRRARC